MQAHRIAWLALFAALAITSNSSAQLYDNKAVKSDQVALPKPAEVQSLTVFPATVPLKGLDDSAQLVITANLAGGKMQDLTGDVTYEITNEKIARHHQWPNHSDRQRQLRNHRPLRRQDRQADAEERKLRCRFADQLRQPNRADLYQARLQLGWLPRQVGRPERFRPVAARLRPGTRLPNARQGKSRPSALPVGALDNSLLLVKATGIMAHAGGKRMEVGSDEYKLIRRWIASGTPSAARRIRPSPRSPSRRKSAS